MSNTKGINVGGVAYKNTADAEDIVYDNTTSGLTATDAQAAIDEIISNTKGTSDITALYHLGFYLDENGGLCQVN